MKQRQRRTYLRYVDKAKEAAEAAVDAFNRVWHGYRDEATLIMLSNAWELLAKAVLLHAGESIAKGQRGQTISAEVAVARLENKKIVTREQVEVLQQVISLRNAACHDVLPKVPDEILQHLLYFSCKVFRDVLKREFPSQMKGMRTNYLSLSFGELTTYADRVQKLVSRMKRSPGDKRLVWLLERGIAFDGTAYITEAQFESQYRGKAKVLPHLRVGGFMKRADMVRIVPIQAPRNFTADVQLRKGKASDTSLPVLVKKTELEVDYPYLTKELGQAVGKNPDWTARACKLLSFKGNPTFHQSVRTSKSSEVHRYSESALQALREKLAKEPGFNPYVV